MSMRTIQDCKSNKEKIRFLYQLSAENQLFFSRIRFFSLKFEPQIALLNRKHITRMMSMMLFI